jgi:hypothetical protein
MALLEGVGVEAEAAAGCGVEHPAVLRAATNTPTVTSRHATTCLYIGWSLNKR